MNRRAAVGKTNKIVIRFQKTEMLAISFQRLHAILTKENAILVFDKQFASQIRLLPKSVVPLAYLYIKIRILI